MTRIHFLCVLALGSFFLLCGTSASAQTILDWNGSSNDSYGNVFNWTPLGVPDTTSESARFDIAGSFDVTLSSGTTTTVSDLIINDGDITFAANAAIFATYTTDDDAEIAGGDFTLSQAGGSGDVVMNVGDRMRVSSDSEVLVAAGSDLNIAGDLQISTLPSSDSLVTIGDSGSTLDVTGNISLGASGGTGKLTIENGATGSVAGRIDMALSGADNTTAELQVLSGAELMTGNMRIGVSTSTTAFGQSSQAFVNGLGSSLTMTGASTLQIGSTNNANVTAELFVQNSAQMTTGTGAIDIVNSGRLIIAGGGVFTNNGQLTIDGGTIDEVQNAGFINGVGSSLTATGGAQLNFTSDKRIDNGVTWTLQGGADYSTDSDFDDLAVGPSTNGTLIVENSGTSVDLSAGGSGIVGSLGGTGTMTVRDSATATFGRLAIGSTSIAGTTGVLNVEDGAVVDTNELEVAELAGTTTSGTVNIGGSGTTSQLVVNGTGTITVGNSTAGDGSGAIHIDTLGELVTGSGQTTIRQTGLIAIEGGTLRANGDIVVDGGELRRSAGSLVLQPGLTLTAQNDGQVNFSSSQFINDQTTYLIQSGADLAASSSLFVGANPGQTGELIIEGAGSTLDVASNFVVGTVGGTGEVTLRSGAQATLSNASLGIAPSNDFSSGVMRVESGANVTSNNLVIGRDGGEQTIGSLVVTGVGSSWEAVNLTLGHALEGQAILEVTAGGTFTTTSAATFNTTGVMTIDGGDVVLDSHVAASGKINLVSGSVTSGSDWVIQAGDVLGHVATLGPGATLATTGAAGVVIETGSVLTLDGGALDVRSITNNGGTFLFNSGTLKLNDGAITGLSSLVIPTNGVLQARGIYDLPVAAQGGSTITSTGNLTLGDASVAGFYANGDVQIQSGATTLHDANDAVFDSGANVTLGDGAGGSANLIANNGLTLDFGGNVSGFGTLDSPDDSATPVINNGHITGNSLAEPITLDGFVKGVGTCDNCNITGTDSPGFSPATVNRGSVSYNGTLEIELGGTGLGEFDRLEHILGAGIADLGGTLEVSLLGGFTPEAGDMFEIITATSVQDMFAVENFPTLAGLEWNVLYGTNNVVLEVLAALAADTEPDGDVDGADFLTLQRNNPSLISAWQTEYGATPSLASSQNVPEPTSLILLLATFAQFLVQPRLSARRRHTVPNTVLSNRRNPGVRLAFC